MKVQSGFINSNNNQYSPKFTSFHQPFKRGNGRLLPICNTYFFGDDIVLGSKRTKWGRVINLLAEKYKNVDKVQIHGLGASICAEEHSFAMMLMEKLGTEKASKFLPIIASDINPKILEEPMNGIVRISRLDKEKIIDNVGPNYSKYLKLDDNFRLDKEYNDTHEVCTAQVLPILRDAVQIKPMDAKTAASQIQGENNVVLGRNFWPYLEEDYRNELADILVEKLSNNNSILGIGNFDCRNADVMKMFKEKGFVSSGVGNWLVPRQSSKSDLLNNPEFLSANFAPKRKYYII